MGPTINCVSRLYIGTMTPGQLLDQKASSDRTIPCGTRFVYAYDKNGKQMGYSVYDAEREVDLADTGGLRRPT